MSNFTKCTKFSEALAAFTSGSSVRDFCSICFEDNILITFLWDNLLSVKFPDKISLEDPDFNVLWQILGEND